MTRDLDLFWRERAELGDSVADARRLLAGEGFRVPLKPGDKPRLRQRKRHELRRISKPADRWSSGEYHLDPLSPA
jgi:hypothetical protein